MNDLMRLAAHLLDLLGPNPYVRAAAVVVAFVILAVVASWLFGTFLRRVVRVWGEWGDELWRACGRPMFITVVLVGCMIATTMVAPSPRSERIVLAILGTLLVITWVSFSLRVVGIVLSMLAGREPRPAIAQPSTATLARNGLKALVILAGIYAVLVTWDVNVTGLVASAGIVGLALSFAAQDTLGNLFAGIAIVTDKPYRVGDYIVLDTGERGEVTHIGLRSTRLLTRDDVEVSIPNGIMGRAKIVNESGGPNSKYRVRVAVGVAYGSDLDQVIAVLIRIATAHAGVCRHPEPRVRFRQFGASSLDLELLCWIEQPALRGVILHELNCEVYRTFGREGIRIPFPQQDVHIRNWPGNPPPGFPDTD